MHAHESNFMFLSNISDFYEIPFFQRGYVWEESNWEDLYNDLMDENSNHFLGSIIIRDAKSQNDIYNHSIIDGQQRLTTISILIRVCYDTYLRYKNNITAGDRSLYDSQMGNMIFHWTEDQQNQSILKPVIKHSLVDAPYFEKAILHGLTKAEMDNITLDSEMKKDVHHKKVQKSTDNNIFKCYKYFYNKINGNLYVCEILRKLLCGKAKNMIVKIELEENENEQAIFDTINTAGVRLSCADTIKNSIFQKAMENANSESSKQYVITNYKNTWESIFAAKDEDIQYWNNEVQVGRFKRSNIEILFQSIALIYGIYDPEKDPLYKIADCYKEYLKKIVKDAKDNNEQPVDAVLKFVKEIVEYATIYRNCFIMPEANSTYTFDNNVGRLFNILSTRGITALHPCILKLFKNAGVNKLDNVTDDLVNHLKKLESYVVRSIICGESIKNLNKECPIILKRESAISDYAKEKNLSDDRFKEGLKNIHENSLGKMLIFWIELYKQYVDKKENRQALFYSTYTLEHIMPQTWQDYWKIDMIPVQDVLTGKIVTDEEAATEIRTNAIYELGNMALLSGSLNSSISNYEFDRKINGDPKGRMRKKDGIRKYANLSTTTEIVNIYDAQKKWDEKDIRKRTDEFGAIAVEIWPKID